jgi:hypothetical protein
MRGRPVRGVRHVPWSAAVALCALASGALLGAGPAGAASAGLPKVRIGAFSGTKPGSIAFSGDSGNIVARIMWTSWNHSTAFGVGSWGYEDCRPNCAQGTVTFYRATIALSRPVRGQFTQLIERQSGPHGHEFGYRLPARFLTATPTATATATPTPTASTGRGVSQTLATISSANQCTGPRRAASASSSGMPGGMLANIQGAQTKSLTPASAKRR